MNARRFLSLISLVLVSMLLLACSSDKIVKSYQGDELPESQLAVLTAPENIRVLSINGAAAPDYLLSNIVVNYGLKVGSNLVEFEYKSVWATSSRGEEGERSKTVQSDVQQVLLDAKAGQRLTFIFQSAENMREAEALVQSFRAEIVDGAGTLVASSVAASEGRYADLVAEHKLMNTIGLSDSKNVAEPADKGLQAIDALKVLWKKASADEKKQFLEWAFK